MDEWALGRRNQGQNANSLIVPFCIVPTFRIMLMSHIPIRINKYEKTMNRTPNRLVTNKLYGK